MAWCVHSCSGPFLLHAPCSSPGAGEPLNDPVQGSSPGGPMDGAGAVADLRGMRSTAQGGSGVPGARLPAPKKPLESALPAECTSALSASLVDAASFS